MKIAAIAASWGLLAALMFFGVGYKFGHSAGDAAEYRECMSQIQTVVDLLVAKYPEDIRITAACRPLARFSFRDRYSPGDLDPRMIQIGLKSPK